MNHLSVKCKLNKVVGKAIIVLMFHGNNLYYFLTNSDVNSAAMATDETIKRNKSVIRHVCWNIFQWVVHQNL